MRKGWFSRYQLSNVSNVALRVGVAIFECWYLENHPFLMLAC